MDCGRIHEFHIYNNGLRYSDVFKAGKMYQLQVSGYTGLIIFLDFAATKDTEEPFSKQVR